MATCTIENCTFEVHSHKCSQCGNIWEHCGHNQDNKEAHTCKNCGAESWWQHASAGRNSRRSVPDDRPTHSVDSRSNLGNVTRMLMGLLDDPEEEVHSGSIPTTPLECPHCGDVNDVMVPGAMPEEGDFVVCAACGDAAVVGPNNIMRIPTNEDMRSVDLRDLAFAMIETRLGMRR